MPKKILSQTQVTNSSSKVPSQMQLQIPLVYVQKSRRSKDSRTSDFRSCNSQKLSLLKAKSSSKYNLNTIFSNKLFTRAKKVDLTTRETYLPTASQMRSPSNSNKMSDLYQIYMKKNNKSEYLQLKRQKQTKRLSLQFPQSPLKNKLPPSLSSLTKIITTHCQIQNNQSHQESQCSQWIDILCEVKLPTSQKTTTHKLATPRNALDNPYELIQLKHRKSKKENSNPACSEV